MNEQANVFLTKMSEKVNNGEYDNYLTIPFLSRKLLISSFKARINKKIETNATPLLSDVEIIDSINDAKEVATATAKIFLELGLLKETENGIEVSEKLLKL